VKTTDKTRVRPAGVFSFEHLGLITTALGDGGLITLFYQGKRFGERYCLNLSRPSSNFDKSNVINSTQWSAFETSQAFTEKAHLNPKFVEFEYNWI
jgi:hypothetical protein